MPPKKGKAKAKGGGGDSDEPGYNHAAFVADYQKYAKSIAVPVHPGVVEQLVGSDEDKTEMFAKSKALVVSDEHPLGPGGCRALATAILGLGPEMKTGPFRCIEKIRVWGGKIGDDGAESLAELLRLGGGEVKLTYLELLNCGVGARGAGSIGAALAVGGNLSLLTLKLDYNTALGGLGVRALCRGLRTNSTLQQLHLSYCGIHPDGGAPLGELLSFTKLGLQRLALQGNKLGGEGLSAIAKGLARSASLVQIELADNAIDATEEDTAALAEFAAAAVACPTLANIDLLYNRIGVSGGEALRPIVTTAGKNISELLVDATLPEPLFDELCKFGGGGKKKKGGKKGGKKKKK